MKHRLASDDAPTVQFVPGSMTPARSTSAGVVPAAPAELVDNALAFPPLASTPSEKSLSALARQSLIQTQRLLIRWSRDPLTTVQALLYPALMLVMFQIVLGNSISSATGTSAIYGQTAMMALVASMVGSMIGAVTLNLEQRDGLLTRFWVLPVHRASSFIGRMIAEIIRIMVTTAIILAMGVVLGFRFDQGVMAAIGLYLVPLMFGVGFASMVTAAAVYGGKARLVELISLATSLLMFFNSGFVPVMAYPVWLQGFVRYQPMSCAVETMKALSVGGPLATPLLMTIGWAVGLVALFIYPAIRGYQRAAQPGR
ncbi:ABC transporter permease [Tomitella biformata]|uniref:ABC transporter permease n=1 Tax=Tomitella biformata TaxID=630403 RepID=UPI0004BBA2F9|nr:ABC transporter permease [Tomitella biformata]